MLVALLGRSLSRMRGPLLAVATLVCAFQIATVLQAASIEQRQAFETLGQLLPGFVQRWLGDNLAGLASFGGVVALGYFHPVVVLLVAIVTAFVASEPAAEVEDGHVDLLLSRAVSRHWLITRSFLIAAACPLVLAGLMMTSTWTTVALAAPPSLQRPSPTTIATLAAHLVAVAWCFGGLSLALASESRRRSAAFTTAATAAVALYFVNVLAASWEPARIADVLSPFHYYQGAAILAGRSNPLRDLTLLGSTAAVLAAVSYWRFSMRDL
jgi:beta-exotoxin I transport system permease protein